MKLRLYKNNSAKEPHDVPDFTLTGNGILKLTLPSMDRFIIIAAFVKCFAGTSYNSSSCRCSTKLGFPFCKSNVLRNWRSISTIADLAMSAADP